MLQFFPLGPNHPIENIIITRNNNINRHVDCQVTDAEAEVIFWVILIGIAVIVISHILVILAEIRDSRRKKRKTKE